MQEFMAKLEPWFTNYPVFYSIVTAAGILLLAFIANYVVKKILLRSLLGTLSRFSKHKSDEFNNIASRLANVVPAVIIGMGVQAVPHLPEAMVTIVRNVCGGFVILTLAIAASSILDLVNSIYMRRPNAHLKPIKGYLQAVKIAINARATSLIIATLIDRSPLILLSGLGAMAAVLMLVFQDTLLSLVASVQISSGDLIRVGEGVEIPQQTADGDVVYIALHTGKIPNWDKTISTIPTKNFISGSFKNWRGMQESGGRRIKRSLLLDQQSIHFLSAPELEHLRKFNLMYGYFDNKEEELNQWNQKHVNAKAGETIDSRRMTNVGTFRAYVERYLRNHPGIHQNMTLMVRQLQPTPEGLPLEIYCFTNSTAWVVYEGVQSDIFDHLIAIAPEFGLRVFQAPSGMDLAGFASNKIASN